MAMRNFPLTDFDFWAFLTSGAVVLAVVDHSMGMGFLDRDRWTLAQGTLAIALAYVVGHVVAEGASRLFEGWLVYRVLGRPSNLLFADPLSAPRTSWLLADYRRPADRHLLASVTRRAEREKLPTDPTSLYRNAYIAARRDAVAIARLTMFQNQYSMCRNVALATLAAVPMLCASGLHYRRLDDVVLAVIAAVISGMMVLRFLKYYRMYSIEVLTAYAGGAGES